MSIKRILAVLALGIVILVTSNHASAQNRTFSYQGYVSDAAKASLTGVHQLSVRLYDAPTDGTVLHSEEFTAAVDNGVFSVIVG
ncbi:MAG TPA: hypothetical protein VFO76_05650, partial [Candidatus Kapabacteria bacterium]|nr:hypothetical protein [Candidatus Kapabacteria bacterium]